MLGFVQDLEDPAGRSAAFRSALCSAQCGQLRLVAVPALGETGTRVLGCDHFFRVESGAGEAVIDGVVSEIRGGFAILAPAGTSHNIINTGEVPLTLYALEASPNHRENAGHRIPERADTEPEAGTGYHHHDAGDAG